jgi:GTP cyclohydrolase II
MILVTRNKKKIIGLEGYGLKIKKQEIISWKKYW